MIYLLQCYDVIYDNIKLYIYIYNDVIYHNIKLYILKSWCVSATLFVTNSQVEYQMEQRLRL